MRAPAAALAVMLAGCSPEPPALPENPIEQASTCSAVTALELGGGEGGAPVAFGGFTRILHPAMILAARNARGVDLRQVMETSQQAPVAMEELRDGDWRALVEPCGAAFPETRRPAGPLPGAPFEAGMMCFGLADFLAQTAVDHPAEGQAAAALANRALAAATPTLRQRAQTNEEALRVADTFTARAFLAGTPSSLLDQCARRFALRSG